jgi:hypothetical protein
MDKVELVPSERIPLAQLDHIMRHTGVDVTRNGEPPGKKFAAIAWWTRNRNGESVTFEQVYEESCVDDYTMSGSGVDPTMPTPEPTG